MIMFQFVLRMTKHVERFGEQSRWRYPRLYNNWGRTMERYAQLPEIVIPLEWLLGLSAVFEVPGQMVDALENRSQYDPASVEQLSSCNPFVFLFAHRNSRGRLVVIMRVQGAWYNTLDCEDS